MNKKLSQKERGEVVTKGFLEDYLDSKNYITRDYLDSKDYATRSHVDSIFNYYQSDMKHHIDSLIEQQHDYFRAIIETLEGRFERNEERLENLDNRVTRLEVRPGF